MPPKKSKKVAKKTTPQSDQLDEDLRKSRERSTDQETNSDLVETVENDRNFEEENDSSDGNSEVEDNSGSKNRFIPECVSVPNLKKRRSIHENELLKSDVLSKFSQQERQTKTPDKKQILSIDDEVTLNLAKLGAICFIIALLCLGIAVFWNSIPSSEGSTFSLEPLKQKYQLQGNFWNSLDKTVNNSRVRNKPSSIVILYQEGSERKIHDMIIEISQYCVCRISRCNENPVIFDNKYLNSEEVLKDFGILISHNKDLLKESGVLVVEDLQNVNGIAAQAFHSICDEYSPLVDRLVILFTMKIDQNMARNENVYEVVEKVLKERWNNIHEDAFDPLVTRIGGVILTTIANKK